MGDGCRVALLSGGGGAGAGRRRHGSRERRPAGAHLSPQQQHGGDGVEPKELRQGQHHLHHGQRAAVEAVARAASLTPNTPNLCHIAAAQHQPMQRPGRKLWAHIKPLAGGEPGPQQAVQASGRPEGQPEGASPPAPCRTVVALPVPKALKNRCMCLRKPLRWGRGTRIRKRRREGPGAGRMACVQPGW